jgi:GxxExxY protein
MNTDQTSGLLERDLTEQIIGTYYAVYNELGAGFLESVYESALSLALEEAGLEVARQSPIAVQFRGRVVGEFRTDILVNGCIIVEIKAATRLTNSHEGQLINYLKATGIHVGLLFNFGPQPEFRRRVF